MISYINLKYVRIVKLKNNCLTTISEWSRDGVEWEWG
jgi:hypothetical protein